ncbi:MAG: RNA 2',3'-cyclic phosphodiesterase [Gemmatimonadales bacterium]
MTVRCFAALPIPAGSREALERASAPFQELGWPVRWVRADGVHVTLKFFGDVPRERADAIAESLEFAVAGIGPLSLALAGFGAFPTQERARVLWAGIDAPPDLELLQDRIETRADGLGFPGEGGVFRPHVTIGRVREGARLPQSEVERFCAATLEAAFTADCVVLYQSTLESGGATYAPLHSAMLRG